MLENIRKYTALFILVLVLIFIGLIFLGDNLSSRGPGSGPVIASTKHESFSLKNLQKDGDAYLRLGQSIIQTAASGGSYAAYGDISQYLGNLQTVPQEHAEEDPIASFLVNRASFKRAVQEYGLYPSVKEIEAYQRESVFTGRDGSFNEETYEEFKDKQLRRLGMAVNDLNDFVGDVLSFKKFSAILGAGVQGNAQAAEENLISSKQSQNLTSLSLYSNDFKESIQPTDEELKTYWEENRGRYLSEDLRRLTYFVAEPDFDALLVAKKEKEAAKKLEEEKAEKESKEEPKEDSEQDSEKSVTELAAEEEEETEEEEIKLTADEREEAVDQLGLSIEENIWVVLQQRIDEGAEEAELEPLAKEFGYEVKTTDLIPVSELPIEIRGAIRGAQGETVEKAVLNASLTTGNPMDSLSEIIGVGSEKWVLFRVDEEVEPTELSFEAAKEEARKNYVEEKALEALTEAIEKKREAVMAAVKEGGVLTEIAEQEGLKLSEHVNMVAGSAAIGEPNADQIFRLAAKTPSGEFSETEVIGDPYNRALFVLVKNREFIESDENKSELTRAVTGHESMVRNALIQHWFIAQFEASDVEFKKLKK